MKILRFSGTLYCILLLNFSVYTQNCNNRLLNVGFRSYKIADTCYNEIDSIEFITNVNFNPKNPTILFLQGSGNHSLLYYQDSINFLITPPFQLQSYLNKYNFVVIAKPETPLCKSWSGPPSQIDTTNPQIITFLQMDFLDYYVKQTAQVIDFLRHNLLNQNSFIYLIGNSQGGHVAAKYADIYSNSVQKIVMYACSAFDRCSEEIFNIRLKAEQQELTQEEAIANITEIYARYKNVKNWVEQNIQNTVLQQSARNNINHALNVYSTFNNYSFEYHNTSLHHLLNIEIPILVVYGTKDTKSLLNEYLPLYFIKNNKNNLTMLPVENCNHFFVQYPDGKYMGDDVFAKIIRWFEDNQ